MRVWIETNRRSKARNYGLSAEMANWLPCATSVQACLCKRYRHRLVANSVAFYTNFAAVALLHGPRVHAPFNQGYKVYNSSTTLRTRRPGGG